ncbi:Ig-like domain-containing protein [Holdemania filiformis]|uniref:Ig-like domain-containing protein n=1 Tax=Holdemania filiformis TaxID=61171 RepID=UPI002431FE73|nr:Ig-like domain-containing protein [Holdemania filiformis]
MAIKSVKVALNGQTYDLTYNSTTKKYEATITAPSTTSWGQNNHVYPLTFTATDVAGNTKSDASKTIRVKETVKPTAAITAPTNGSTVVTNKPAITVQFRDAGSGVLKSSIVLKVDNTAVAAADYTLTDVSGGVDLSYTPKTALTDGSHTITASCSDNDGNTSTVVSVTYKQDTTPPALTVNQPATPTNKAACTISGTTSDATSSPVTVKITLNGTDQGAITVDSSGNFSKQLTLKEGSNAIVVRSTDAAGKYSEITRTVVLDTVAPVFGAITVTPDPVNTGGTITITVEVTDA